MRTATTTAGGKPIDSSSINALPRLSETSLSSPPRRSFNSISHVFEATIVADPSVHNSSNISSIGDARFLGRMSWDHGLLDASTTASQSSLRGSASLPTLASSPLRMTNAILPPSPTSATTSVLLASPGHHSPTKGSPQHQPTLRSLTHSESAMLQSPHKHSAVLAAGASISGNSGLLGPVAQRTASCAMSLDESMREVEQLLNANVRHRYYDRCSTSVQEIAALRQAEATRNKQTTTKTSTDKHTAARTRRFVFAPLRDPLVLAAAVLDEDEEGEEGDEEGDDDVDDSTSKRYVGRQQSSYRNQRADNDIRGASSDNDSHTKRSNDHASIDTDDNDDGVSSHVRRKYFGAAAKRAYYTTYQELHAKPQLFVEQSPHAQQATNAQSALGAASSLHSSSHRESERHALHTHAAPTATASISTHAPTDASHATTLSPPPLPSRRRQALQSSSAAAAAAAVASSTSLTDATASTLSPRVQFLASCITQSHPALSILLRKHNCRAFDFSHQGLGDAFIEQFASCLPDLPLVDAINVSDNRLSDAALNRLLQALENKPLLTLVDISANEIGAQSAQSLRQYVASSLCTITTLVLNNADVDDHECTLFMTAFEQNKSVARLSLRSNRIGQIVRTNARGRTRQRPLPLSTDSSMTPTQWTGGESIGAMLNVNLNIQTLDLSWNLLKPASAAPIAQSLTLNYNLRELNLSYNACGDAGAMVFGQTIRINAALTKLNLSYNSIGAKGALVLASGLTANRGLRELVLDGNAIGLESGRTLMHASCTRVGSNAVCHLSLFECNLTTSMQAASTASAGAHATTKRRSDALDAPANRTRKDMTLFNAADPTGTYVLDLSDPYEHMIAHELLRIATFKRGYRFHKLEYVASGPPTNSNNKIKSVGAATIKIELSRRPLQLAGSQTATTNDHTSSSSASVLQHRSPVALLFAQIDKDASGSVELPELTLALRAYGLAISETRLAALVHEYDYDQSGSLQLDEFTDLFLRCGFAMMDTDHSGTLSATEITNVLRFIGVRDVSLQRIKHMLAQYDLDGSGAIDEHEFLEFMKHEMLGSENESERLEKQTTLDDAYEAIALRDASGVIWKVPLTGMLTVAFDVDSEHSIAAAAGSNNTRRRSTAFASSQSVSDAVVAKLVASVQGSSRNSIEQTDFLNAVLTDSDLFFSATQAEQLLEKQGELRTTARKLAALERILPQMTSRREAIALVARLVEPRKQWSERFLLRRRVGNLYTVMLGSLTNKFVFDLTSSRDCAALKKLALVALDEKQFSKNRASRSDTSQHGNYENFRHATIDGAEVLLTSTFILNTLLAPAASAESAAGRSDSSNIKRQRHVAFYYVSTTRPPRGTRTLTRRRFEQLLDALAESIVIENDAASIIQQTEQRSDRNATSTDVLDKARVDARLRWEIVRHAVRRPRTSSTALQQRPFTRNLPGVFRVKSTLDSVQLKLAQLEMLVTDRWLHSEQAATLVDAFPDAIHARVRAACIVFSRIIDVENFVHIYDRLSGDDQYECIRRLGWLNVFDPMQPERQYPPLDLSVHDERELVQMLAQLALTEGRETWREPAYYFANRDITGQCGPPTTLLLSAELPPPAWGRADVTGDHSLKHHGFVRVRFETPASPIVAVRPGSASTDQRISAAVQDTRVQLRARVLCGTRLYL